MQCIQGYASKKVAASIACFGIPKLVLLCPNNLTTPMGVEKEHLVNASWRNGAKKQHRRHRPSATSRLSHRHPSVLGEGKNPEDLRC